MIDLKNPNKSDQCRICILMCLYNIILSLKCHKTSNYLMTNDGISTRNE